MPPDPLPNASSQNPPIENRKSKIENQAAILEEIAATLSRFVSLPDHGLTAASLFVLHTYAFDPGNVSPTLFITGSSRRCGKSKFLNTLSRLVASPFAAGSFTSRALYHDIEQRQPTLCFDDVDSYVRNKDQLRALINSSNRDIAFHLGLARGADRQPDLQRLTTWTPRIFSGIGKIADSLRDFSITIEMTRHPARESLRHGMHFEHLCAKMRRFVEDHREAIGAANPSVPETVRDQAADHWAPLLVLADLAGGDWPDKARRAAVALSGGDGSIPSGDAAELIADIRQVFLDNYVRTLSSRDLANYLANLKGRPWAEMGKLRRPITQNQLADLLRQHDIAPHTVRIGSRTPRGYVFSDFKDAYRRCLAQKHATGCNTATSPVNIEQNGDSEGETDPAICSFDDTDWSDIDPPKPGRKIYIPPDELEELERQWNEKIAREKLEEEARLQTESETASPITPPALITSLSAPPPHTATDSQSQNTSAFSLQPLALSQSYPSELELMQMDPWTRALHYNRRQIEERNQPGYKPYDPVQAALDHLNKLINTPRT